MAKKEAKQEEKPIVRDWVEDGLHWFEHATLECMFALPERITVRVFEQWTVAKLAAVDGGATSAIASRWIGAVDIIKAWECDMLPDFCATIDDIANEQLAVINWVGMAVHNHMLGMVTIPKN